MLDRPSFAAHDETIALQNRQSELLAAGSMAVPAIDLCRPGRRTHPAIGFEG